MISLKEGKNLLYLSCHSTLEACDLRTYSDLGFTVQSTGFYAYPARPTHDHLLPRLFSTNPLLYDEFRKLNPDYTYGYDVPLHFTKEFVDKFDVIVVSWRYDYLQQYWDLFKDKHVVFESAGQSDANREKQIAEIRKKGIKVTGVMTEEENYQGFGGRDKFIWLYVDIEEENDWNGEDESILVVNSSSKIRAYPCNTNLFLQLSKNLPVKFYGLNNDGLGGALGPLNEKDLKEVYKNCRLFFSLGSKPSPITYNFLEAMAAGCPVVTWGPRLGNFPGFSTYAMHKYIDNGVSGFYSDNPVELRQYCQALLEDQDLARKVGNNGRDIIKKYFTYELVKERWKELFEEMGLL